MVAKRHIDRNGELFKIDRGTTVNCLVVKDQQRYATLIAATKLIGDRLWPLTTKHRSNAKLWVPYDSR